jgi:hypothetical protein
VFALLKLHLIGVMFVGKKNPLDQCKKARVFPEKLFLVALMFVSEARTYPNGTH